MKGNLKLKPPSRGSKRNTMKEKSNHQKDNKSRSITGSNVVSGWDSSQNFPHPPDQDSDLGNNEYEYSLPEVCPEYNQYLQQQPSYSKNTSNKLVTGLVPPMTGIKIQHNTEILREHASSGVIISSNANKTEKLPELPNNTSQQDWMPMRQLHNAHKL